MDPGGGGYYLGGVILGGYSLGGSFVALPRTAGKRFIEPFWVTLGIDFYPEPHLLSLGMNRCSCAAFQTRDFEVTFSFPVSCPVSHGGSGGRSSTTPRPSGCGRWSRRRGRTAGTRALKRCSCPVLGAGHWLGTGVPVGVACSISKQQIFVE